MSGGGTFGSKLIPTCHFGLHDDASVVTWLQNVTWLLNPFRLSVDRTFVRRAYGQIGHSSKSGTDLQKRARKSTDQLLHVLVGMVFTCTQACQASMHDYAKKNKRSDHLAMVRHANLCSLAPVFQFP